MNNAFQDARFNRYYRRIELGLRLLAHGARPQTASDWSGLTQDRLVTLKRRWMPDASSGLRGPPPTSFQPFFRSLIRAQYAAIFASLHRAVTQTSESSTPSGKIATSLDDGERLCEAFEICREWQPDSTLEFDQAVLLARGITKNEEIELGRCATCKCALLIDRLAVVQDKCDRCRRQARRSVMQRSRSSSNPVSL
jgi:Flagellar transcriptional activator (FlhC)